MTGVRYAMAGVSVIGHVALIAVAPHASSRPIAVAETPASQWVEVESVTRDDRPEVPAASPVVADEPKSHGAPPVAAPRVKIARAAPVSREARATSPATSTSDTALSPPLPTNVTLAHFTLAPSSQWSANLATSAASTANTETRATGTDAVVPERQVSTRAKLLTAADVAYPAAARAAEIEADVPVEIVVDTRGLVADARPLARSGYGLDAAALAAIRGYRFEPAQRDGHRVAVRMRWQVSFRLR